MSPTSGGSSRPTGGLDVLFDAMAHPHRRFLLSRLHAGEGPLSVREVAAEIAAWEGGEPERRPADVEAIAANFHHVHVPKLTDADVVEYDAEAETIARGRRAAEAERYLPGT